MVCLVSGEQLGQSRPSRVGADQRALLDSEVGEVSRQQEDI